MHHLMPVPIEEQLGQALDRLLGSMAFRARAAEKTESDLRTLISDMCRESGIDVTVIHVEMRASPSGSHRVVWQPIAGGPFLDQWFRVTVPA
jgi:hypothetical protein